MLSESQFIVFKLLFYYFYNVIFFMFDFAVGHLRTSLDQVKCKHISTVNK